MNNLINKLSSTNLFMIEEKENLENFLKSTPLDIDTEDYIEEVFSKLKRNIKSDIIFLEENEIKGEFKEEIEIYNLMICIKNIFIHISIFNTMFKLIEINNLETKFVDLAISYSNKMDEKIKDKIISSEIIDISNIDSFIYEFSKKNNITDKNIDRKFFYKLIS